MQKKELNIVVGSSLNPASILVVEAAGALAKASGGRLHVVHASSPPISYGGTGYGLTSLAPGLLEVEKLGRREQVKTQLRRIGLPTKQVGGITIEIEVPHRLILEVAENEAADLIVVGASESAAPVEAILGSTADRVVRKAQVPVLVVREGFELPLRKVVAPVDLSPLCADAMDRGLEVVDGLMGSEGAQKEALFVLRPSDREGNSGFSPEQVDRFAADELQRFTASLGGRIQRTVALGMPRQAILEHLQEARPQLVVMGTLGRSGFERFMLGSIASYVLRRARGNVLVVPPADPGDKERAESGASEEARAEMPAC